MSQPSAGDPQPGRLSEYPSPQRTEGPDAEPPTPVRTSVKLMWVGAALTLLGLLFVPLQIDAIRDQVAEQAGPGVDTDTVFNSAIAFAIVIGLISVGLWALMAVMTRKGKGWARITATVLAGLNILVTLSSLTGATGATPTLLALIPSVASVIVAGVIVYLLWQRPASEWFEAMSRRSA